MVVAHSWGAGPGGPGIPPALRLCVKPRSSAPGQHPVLEATANEASLRKQRVQGGVRVRYERGTKSACRCNRCNLDLFSLLT